MNKLIILTPSIIRGDFHVKSIGKFYTYFYKYFKLKYKIYHIINIDEPVNLKKYFNKYETIGVFNKIIPKDVNKVYIMEPNIGFLQAWKKIVLKIEELNLVNDSYLYYWLEDDWEPKISYDITNFFDLLNFSNSAYTITDKAPLGSFRGGPFMTGSYFSNIFNIYKYMNTTCDPERQMQRWLRGGCQKNGNLSIHRLSVPNSNVSVELIHIIIVCDEFNIELEDLNKYHYKTGFDESIEFKFHIITYNIKKINFKYSQVDNFNNFKLADINCDKLNDLFHNNFIKYFILKPSVQFDIGRDFNKEYGLLKWMKIEDNTGYNNINFYNAFLGNSKIINEDDLRLNPEYTMNKCFFCAFAYIQQCLPYLEKNYFNKEIKLNIQYYSHIYGSYPNFQVIGDLIQLNYAPSINCADKQFDELNCLMELCEKICDKQIYNKNILQFLSYKDNFELSNQYFNKYFKFNGVITDEVNKFIKKFVDKRVLGIDYSMTDKNKVKYVTHVNIEEFIKIIRYYLAKNYYDIIFINADDNNFIARMKENYLSKYEILYYGDLKKNVDDNSTYLNRLTSIKNKIKEIKASTNDINKMVLLENDLKKETETNRLLLQNDIVNSLILSKCDCVLKTCSQISAYSKIFNPKLKIYRINECQEGYWPDSHIDLFNWNEVEDIEIKKLLKTKLIDEFDGKKNKSF